MKTAKKKARILQKATGFTYDACLRIITGDMRLTPQAGGCRVEMGLRLADAHPLTLADPKPCTCEVRSP